MKKIWFEEECLGDVIAEIQGVTSNIGMLSALVGPNQKITEIDLPSEEEVSNAFFAVTRQLDHIVERLNAFDDEWLQEKRKTATPTVESKDRR